MDIYQRLKTRQHGANQLTQQKIDDLYRWLKEQGGPVAVSPTTDFVPITDPTLVAGLDAARDYLNKQVPDAESEVCPSCGAGPLNFKLEGHDAAIEGGFFLDLTCSNCGAAWSAVYQLNYVDPTTVDHGQKKIRISDVAAR